jgi:magnesium transporter
VAAPTIRVMEIPAKGPLRVVAAEGAMGMVGPPPEGGLVWIDLERQDEASLALLRERFDFHPLALEDCAHFDQRPKLEEYGDYLFVVLHGFLARTQDGSEVEPLELHAFIGRSYLVTVHEQPIPELDTVWRRIGGDAALARRGVDFVFYTVVDAIVDSNFVILDRISDTLDDIEDQVLHQHEEAHLGRMFTMKKTLVAMRRVLSPQRDVFAILSKRGHPCISDRTSLYFRDVYDHLIRIYEGIDTGRDLLGNALDAYLSMVAQRTNDIMKRLTILSAVFLPLTFVTGFFGQNFESLPFKSDAIMWVGIGLCGAIPAVMALWFWRSRWL